MNDPYQSRRTALRVLPSVDEPLLYLGQRTNAISVAPGFDDDESKEQKARDKTPEEGCSKRILLLKLLQQE